MAWAIFMTNFITNASQVYFGGKEKVTKSSNALQKEEFHLFVFYKYIINCVQETVDVCVINIDPSIGIISLHEATLKPSFRTMATGPHSLIKHILWCE
jgi:hypothetical protein